MISKKAPLKHMLELGEVYCGKCGHCCEFGGTYLTDTDMNALASYLNISKAELKKKYLDEHELFHNRIFKTKIIKSGNKPYGKCVFYHNSKKCTVHNARPLYCRIGTCKAHSNEAIQWFYLNYLVNEKDSDSVREWAMFLTCNDAIPGGQLKELVPDLERLNKILDYRIIKKTE